MSTIPSEISFEWEFKKLEPPTYTREVRRVGFMRWCWFIGNKHGTLTNGPFLTRRAALRDMAKYPL